MHETTTVKAGKLSIELPIVPLVGQDFSIILFDSFGDTKLIEILAKEAVENFTKPDVIICPEAKAIPLCQEIARRFEIDYFVLRKTKKLYMKEPKKIEYTSITTNTTQELWYDFSKVENLKNKKIMLFDDVISTGGTISAMIDFVKTNKLDVSSIATIFVEGDSQYRDNLTKDYNGIESLGKLQLLK